MRRLIALLFISTCACGESGGGGEGLPDATVMEMPDSKMIGPLGGSISTASGVIVIFPPNALASDTLITVLPSSAIVPNAVGPAYKFGPEGLVFAQPVTVTLPFLTGRIPNGRSATEVVIETAPVGSPVFVSIGGELMDPTHISSTTTHFSICVAVVPPTLTTLSIEPQGALILGTDTLQLHAFANFSDGTRTEITDSAMWGSVDENVFTVSDAPGSKGLATGTGDGTVSAFVIYEEKTAATDIQVAALQRIDLDPAQPMIAVDASLQFHATGVYTNQATRPLGDAVTWASSSTVALSIDEHGLATRHSADRVTVSAALRVGLGTVRASVVVAPLCEVIATDMIFDRSSFHGNANGTVIVTPNGEVFWFDFDPAAGEFGGTIYSNAGGSALSTIPLVTGLRAVNALAADNFYVYWTEVDATAQGYEVKRAFMAGGSVEPIYTGPEGLGGGARGLAVGNGFVYWADGAGNSTRSCPGEGTCITSGIKYLSTSDLTGAPLQMGRGPLMCMPMSCGPGVAPIVMIADGAYVYGLETEMRRVVRVALGDDAIEVVSGNLSNPGLGLAQDDPVFSVFDPKLYFSDVGGMGKIFRWSKSGGAAQSWDVQLGGSPTIAVDDQGWVYYGGTERADNVSMSGVWKRRDAEGPVLVAGEGCGGSLTGSLSPLGVAVDLSSIYFSDASGRVLKIRL